TVMVILSLSPDCRCPRTPDTPWGLRGFPRAEPATRAFVGTPETAALNALVQVRLPAPGRGVNPRWAHPGSAPRRPPDRRRRATPGRVQRGHAPRRTRCARGRHGRPVRVPPPGR